MVTVTDSDRCRDFRIILYFEHQGVKSYIVSQSDGLERKEFERGYQYFIEGYVFGVKGNHFLVRCCVDLVSLFGNTCVQHDTSHSQR